MYFDVSRCIRGSRAGITLISPQNDIIPMSYKLSFECTNNMAKYEALILGLKATIEIDVTHLHIYEDSQLIVNQINEIYNTKDEKLIPYKDLVAKLVACFEEYQLENIPRNNSRLANAMASAASLIPIEVERRETTFAIKNLGTPSIVDENLKMVFVAQ